MKVSHSLLLRWYADEETRTLTPKTLEPKSSASTNSATSAKFDTVLHTSKNYSKVKHF
ncbi:hypothetical protein H1P_1220021 [Hyella patelloides LEGE 07179]|uniref:Uncharacterized protein n=1 Tax=Hyella patelloides LEGE 07179 TaxID=945734 RepID=A0A563VKB6_9CYAN|nr:hypothetical protein H1P_1220021 [Hyella patelloides LEGE 07179]